VDEVNARIWSLTDCSSLSCIFLSESLIRSTVIPSERVEGCCISETAWCDTSVGTVDIAEWPLRPKFEGVKDGVFVLLYCPHERRAVRSVETSAIRSESGYVAPFDCLRKYSRRALCAASEYSAVSRACKNRSERRVSVTCDALKVKVRNAATKVSKTGSRWLYSSVSRGHIWSFCPRS
jgi:hypothetical protein